MKYSENNKPIVCMMTQSTCYKGTSTMNPKGVLWHSTGCNNPNLKRYVQPSDNAPDREEMLKLLGTNSAKNDWNHKTVQAGLNCWIGKLADGTITTVQTMPWNYKPWGCGAGSKGSCNNGWMQFEICEDNLTSKSYFEAVYEEACEITAYYCKMYNLDPRGTVRYQGIDVPVILDHGTSCSLGLGSNHGDVMHWFKKYGKDLDDVRNDVAKLMGITGTPIVNQTASSTTSSSTTTTRQTLKQGARGNAVKELQTILIKLGYSCGSSGVDGSFGNATLSAVKKFQKEHGLAQDGSVGPLTWAAIDKALEELESSKVETPTPAPTPAPAPETTQKPATSASFKEGEVITLAAGATWSNGQSIPDWVKKSTLYYRGARPTGEILISVLKTGGITGSVAPKYVVGAQTSTNTTAPKEEVKEEPKAFEPYVIKVTANLLNYRSGPGSEYPAKGQIKKGGAYTIVEEKDGWGKLKSGAGWIMLEHTQKI